MDILSFIIYQQTTYPTACFAALIYLGWMGIALAGVLLLHGWPTQKMFYCKVEAQPEYREQRIITGSLNDDYKNRKQRRQDFNKWFNRNKKGILIALGAFCISAALYMVIA